MSVTLPARLSSVEAVTETISKAQADRIVWIDCEMTGLDIVNDALIEVAALVTDFELNVLGSGVDLVIRPPDAALAIMGDFVRQMHTDSGLLDQLAEGTTLEDAQAQLMEYVRHWVPESRKAPLGGNTVSTDRAFLARDMPEVESHLHYRIIDVSSIKELSRRWFPRASSPAPAKTAAHRALAAIPNPSTKLSSYRKAVFKAQPVP